MTISSQAPASLTSGSASSELARTVSDEPQQDRAAGAEQDRPARFFGAERTAGERDQQGVVGAEQQIDEEDLDRE